MRPLARLARALGQFTQLQKLDLTLKGGLTNDQAWQVVTDALNGLEKLRSVTITVPANKQVASPNWAGKLNKSIQVSIVHET